VNVLAAKNGAGRELVCPHEALELDDAFALLANLVERMGHSADGTDLATEMLASFHLLLVLLSQGNRMCFDVAQLFVRARVEDTQEHVGDF